MKKILTCLALSLGTWIFSPAAVAAVSISIHIAPPLLPIYVQPAPPADDYLWMPGYWAWSDDGYFWVPGTWVLAPQRGYLWTPGYWSWGNGLYHWHQGYWGPHVGFYGGVDYGYGYYGSGYSGGRWDGDRFYYNRTVNNVNVTHIHNTYNETVIHNATTVNRVSYNGGQGGITARPHDRDVVAGREPRRGATEDQVRHERGARGNRELRASVNNGRPPIAATPKPGAFTDRHARPASGDLEPRPDRQHSRQVPAAAQQQEQQPPPPREQQREQSRQRDSREAQQETEPRRSGQKEKQKPHKSRNKPEDAEPEARQ